MKKIAVFLLISLLLPLCLQVRARTLDGWGDLHTEYTETISPGLDYSEIYASGESGRQHGYVFEYTPNNGSELVLTWGDKITGRDTLTAMIDQAENMGYDVVGGINGDFFSMQTGVPLSAMIYQGRLLTSDAGASAIGITTSGNTIIGNPEIQLTLHTADGSAYPISHFNKYPTEYNSYLLTSDFGDSTMSKTESREIIIRLNDNLFTPFCTVSGIIETIYDNAIDTPIPEGCVILSVNNKSALFEASNALLAGASVTIEITCADDWRNIDIAIGGGDIILHESEIPDGIVNEDHEKRSNPRTAVGITETGKLIFLAVDGRNDSIATGMTLSQLGVAMKSLGCVSALNLDGGGSTTAAVRHSWSRNVELANTPSDGSERKIANAILFVNTLPVTENLYDIALSPSTATVHAKGGAVALEHVFRDTSLHIIDRDFSDISVEYTVRTGSGYVQDGRFFAGENAGTVLLSASAQVDGITVTGETTVNVVNALDDFKASSTSYVLPAGADAKIVLTGYKTGLPVNVAADNFSWNFIDDKVEHESSLAACQSGYIDLSGTFHANPDAPSGETVLAVTYGYKTIYLTIEIGLEPQILNDFENDRAATDIFTTVNENSLLLVTGGKRSSKALSFKGCQLSYLEPVTLLHPIQSLSLWVKGDTADICFATATTADERNIELYYQCEADYTDINGWKLLVAEVPKNTAQPLVITAPFASLKESDIIIDNITVNYGEDSFPFEDIEGNWACNSIVAIYDMEITDGEIVNEKRFYSPDKNLTRAQFAKMLASYLGLSSNSDSELLATLCDRDTLPEWAIPYIGAVLDAGMMSGKRLNSGEIKFDPNATITRAEVMHVLGKLVKADTNDTQTFTDSNDIPSWAIENINRVVSAGIVTGYTDGSIRPMKQVTRAEIAAIFERLNRNRA